MITTHQKGYYGYQLGYCYTDSQLAHDALIADATIHDNHMPAFIEHGLVLIVLTEGVTVP
jgi:hypothetical protein